MTSNSTSPFSTARVCAFDAYGTLLDVHAPAKRLADRMGGRGDDVSDLWRRKQLEYTWLRSLNGNLASFRQVTEDALDYALDRHQIRDAPLRNELLALYDRLEAYPDAAECLAALKAKGMPVAILSNGDADMLKDAIDAAKIAEHLDAVLTADAVGIFKPSPKIYQMVGERFKLNNPSEACFVSANPWDAQSAAQFGFVVARVDRFGLPDDRIPGTPDALIPDLSVLPSMLT